MKAKVIWYSKEKNFGEAITEEGDIIRIYERSFKSDPPSENDVIFVVKAKKHLEDGKYAYSARILRQGTFKPKVAKAA